LEFKELEMGSAMEKSDYVENIREIRHIMEQSAKFVSLDGLSGVAAGTVGIIATLIAALKLGGFVIDAGLFYEIGDKAGLKVFFLIWGIAALTAALAVSYHFTARKAKKHGLKMWDNTSRRFFFNLFFPLSMGGLFVAAMIYHGVYGFLFPAMLLFYGLALLNASKYSRSEIRYLGILTGILGILAAFSPPYGLIFWGTGFGILNGIYGFVMYVKYEK
jgi:hypothetical protein